MHRVFPLIVLVLVVSSATTASATTWLIKPNGTGDAPHIAAGVDSCMPGDSLLLDTGTFIGPNNRQITVDKSIVIYSVAGPAATTIDCDRAGMAFDFVGAQSSALNGVTIAWSWTQTGEIVPVNVRTSVSLVVSDCVFRDGRGSQIGAIACDGSSSLDVSDSEFRDNFGTIGTGAISSNGVFTNVRNCWFESNGSNGGGGALRVSNPDLPSVIENNTFWNNTGNQLGAAVGLTAVSAPQVLVCRNNTIVGNSGHPDFSGAIFLNGDFALIEFNIIAFNNVKAFYCNPINSHASIIRCNNFFSNTGGNQLCLDAIGSDNVAADPLFCDAANGVFSLDLASPSAPANNSCGVLFGAWPVDCIAMAIGDGTPDAEYKLLANAPNPFNPETVIRYSVPSRGAVTLEIFDVSGARVRTFTREHAAGGVKLLAWDGRNDRGRLVSSGVYVYRMTAPGFTQSRKMLLLK